MNRGAPVPTRAFAERLIAAGHVGLLAPSFAAGATAVDLNVVLWRWNAGEGARLDLIDDEGRLGP